MAQDKVIIVGEKVEEMKSFSKELEKSMNKTLTDGKKVLRAIEASTWDGETRDSIVSYLDILTDYHTDLHEATEKQIKLFNKLDSYVADYTNHHSVQEVKKL